MYRSYGHWSKGHCFVNYRPNHHIGRITLLSTVYYSNHYSFRPTRSFSQCIRTDVWPV